MAGKRKTATTTARLHYVGPNSEAGVLPLPEGWPAEDHEEHDAASRAEKLASGHYETQGESFAEGTGGVTNGDLD